MIVKKWSNESLTRDVSFWNPGGTTPRPSAFFVLKGIKDWTSLKGQINGNVFFHVLVEMNILSFIHVPVGFTDYKPFSEAAYRNHIKTISITYSNNIESVLKEFQNTMIPT